MRIERLLYALAVLAMVGGGCGDDPATTSDTVDAVADAVADGVPDSSARVDTSLPIDGSAPPSNCVTRGCEDGNPCTVDRCDEQLSTCVHEPVANGTLCGCNESGTCFGGICGGGEVFCTSDDDCTDTQSCTINRCDGGCRCTVELIPECIE
ncbi:MAG: hypothetical protein H6744_09530 [Deltaproteobacteria bacterium]|nr:hypothetical protein [Deltaproteobacteria bacterium]